MTLDFNNSPAVSNTKISVLIIAVLCLILLFSSKLLLARTLHMAQLSTSLYSHTINYDQVEFNLLTRSVTKRPNLGSSQRTAKLQANSFSIKNWQQQYLPLLDGLPVNVNGKSLTICISDDETQFFIATDKEQALLSSKGDIIWKHGIKELASEAVISYDQQYIIVRYNNDIVRWYDYQSGDRLFSLFIQPKSLQWIIWSANGYYDSSDPGFEPVTFEHNNTGSTSLSQLRHYLFRPDIIQKAVAGDRTALLAAITLPKDTTAPSISSLNDIDDSNEKLFFCIKNSSSGPVRVIFAMNDVTIQRKTISTTGSSKYPQCTHVVSFRKIHSATDYLLTIRAFDLDKKIWSMKFDQEVSSSGESFEKQHTKLIYMSDESGNLNSSKNSQLIAGYFKKAILQKINLRKNSNKKSNRKISENEQSSPFILYLSSICEVTDNDILFIADKNNKKSMTLSRLKNYLQATNNTHSLIFLDCVLAKKPFNRSLAKKSVHNFMFETGRNILIQFTKQKERLKESYMMDTLGLATRGDADKDDNLSIDSNELMDFMISTLPETTFEGSGDYGVIFSQLKRNNSFVLPLLLEE